MSAPLDEGDALEATPLGDPGLAYGRTAAAMDAALEVAARAGAEHGDVPVGAAVFRSDTGAVVAVAANARERLGDPTAHAEILAVREASAALGSWRLDGCSIAVTLEPCPMCAGALVLARIDHLYLGAPDPKAGACGSLYNVVDDPRLNHTVQVTRGVRAAECAAVLVEFFAQKRRDAP